MNIIRVDGFELVAGDDDEPRVRDVDLAGRLGYEEPRAIRKLIRRMVDDGEISEPSMRDAVSRIEKRGSIQGTEERTVREYWLDEDQALATCMLSRTPRAVEVRRAMRAMFRAAVQQLRDRAAQDVSAWERLISRILAPKPTDWEECFQASLVAELCKLDQYPWSGGRHPPHLKSTNRKIYNIVFSTAVGRALKAKSPNPRFGRNFHQFLCPEAREYFVRQLEKVEAIARQSESKADFWVRLEREYGGGMLQMPMHLEAS